VNAQQLINARIQEAQTLIGEAEDFLEREHLTSTRLPAQMFFWQITAICRTDDEPDLLKHNTAKLYAALAAVGTASVFIWRRNAKDMLELIVGVEMTHARTVRRLIRGLLGAVKLKEIEMPTDGSRLWTLEALGDSRHPAAVDEVVGCISPGTSLALVLQPCTVTRKQLAEIDHLRMQLSRFAHLHAQDTESSQHTRSENSGSSSATTTNDTKTESDNTGEVRLRSRQSSKGNSTGVSLVINSGINSGTGQGASIAHTISKGLARALGISKTKTTTTGSGTADMQGASLAENLQIDLFAIQELEKRLKRLRDRMEKGKAGMLLATYFASGTEQQACCCLGAVQAALALSYGKENECPERPPVLRRADGLSGLTAAVRTPAMGRASLPTELLGMLPMKEQPGLILVSDAEYGKNIVLHDDAVPIKIGWILDIGGRRLCDALLDTADFTGHITAVGSTGSGKTTLLRGITWKTKRLNPGVHMLVMDPKDEWCGEWLDKEACVLTARTDLNHDILRIAPFAVVPGASIQQHIEELKDVLEACWPLSAAMPAILRQALYRAYAYCGWDVSRGVRVPLPGRPKWPDFGILERETLQVIREGGWSDRCRQDYEGALCTRLHMLSTDGFAQILTDEEQALSPQELFDGDVVIHLGALTGETLSVIMSILLLLLREYRAVQCDGKHNLPLSHICLFEEAHHLMRRTAGHNEDTECVSVSSHASETISKMFKELRTYGECCILSNQSLADISEDAVINTATKIVFQSTGKYDQQVVQAALSLEDEGKWTTTQVGALARLRRGEAVVYQRSWEGGPVKIYAQKLPESECSECRSPLTARARFMWSGQMLEQILGNAERGKLESLCNVSDVARQLRRQVHIQLDGLFSANREVRFAARQKLTVMHFGSMMNLLPPPTCRKDTRAEERDRLMEAYCRLALRAAGEYADLSRLSMKQCTELLLYLFSCGGGQGDCTAWNEVIEWLMSREGLK